MNDVNFEDNTDNDCDGENRTGEPPHDPPHGTGDVRVSTQLADIMDRDNEWKLLADSIQWSDLEKAYGKYFRSVPGRPTLSCRTVFGFLYLQAMLEVELDEVIRLWIENPYFQYFTGERTLQKKPPLTTAAIIAWHKRIKASDDSHPAFEVFGLGVLEFTKYCFQRVSQKNPPDWKRKIFKKIDISTLLEGK